ncbi:MAG: YihY/virulence factor BrkB family protein [Oculatellaceae cyanobacterium bins.114]|nr:YihY/virulence factor BrkB family protein [Oculatellaceae cyanobacterium bins.114]
MKKAWRLLTETIAEWNKDKASQMAAALAYYTVFSLAPLLIIAIAVAGFFFGEEAARGEIVGQIKGLVGTDGATVIQTALENSHRPGSNTDLIASLISIVVLIFGASGVFVQLQEALNEIWDVDPNAQKGVGNVVRKRAMSFAVVLSIGFLLLVSLVISAALSAINTFASELLPGFGFIWEWVNVLLSFAVTTLLFALIYKYLPDIEITWHDVWIGAILTSILFSIGRYLIGLYLGNSSFGSTYGAAGSLVILLAWIYYSVQILFFGAEFTQVYARRYGSQVKPLAE